MKITSFSLCTNRKRIFKPGAVDILPDEILEFGNEAALFTGGASLKKSGKLDKIIKSLEGKKISFELVTVDSEPSPETVDRITAMLRGRNIDVIAAVGGGSVIDAAKAVSAMLCEEGSISDYLEGVGTRKSSGRKVPLIAVPTTAGTGSEATFNAVISRVGDKGFKKSLRHTNYIPETAIIDPELYSGCPASVAASSGMDALAQLIESYLSVKSTFYTDILALGAIEAMFEALPIITSDGSEDEYCDAECGDAWFKMAYGAYISGLTLSNCGYCIVHGMAGAVGGFFKIPHGTICGSLLAAGMKKTIEKLEKEEPESPALLKFSRLGYIAAKSDDILPKEARAKFIQVLESMTDSMGIPLLSDFGITDSDLPKIADASSSKNSPVQIERDEIIEILKSRL